MNQALQTKRKVSNWVYIAPAAAALLALAAYAALRTTGPTTNVGFSYHRVATGPLDVSIRKDGEIQAVNNIDVICEVEGSTTITFLVKEGASVKKGDVLVELDSSTIKQKIEDTGLDVQKADADVTSAREFLEIQKSQNAANLEAAEGTLAAAKIDLQKYEQGDYPQQQKDAKTAVDMAAIDLQNKESDFKQVQDLAAQGFLTTTDVKLRQVDLVKSRNALDAAQTTYNNLLHFGHEKDLQTFKTALSQAEQRLIRTKRENSANLTQKQADLQAKEQTLLTQRRKLEHNKDQFAACTIKAPEDGLVVYASSNDRNAQAQIQEGAQIRERQMILRLPDTSKMKAVVRIQEAQIAKIREGLRASVTVVGVPRPLQGVVTKISVLADSSQRWFNPDLKEYPVDIELDETPVGLKPGLGASSEISVARLENIIAVPVTTIYSSGTKTYVFTRPIGEGEPKPRVVQLGMANDSMVQVTDGVSTGEEVLVLQAGQGRELLVKAGIPDEPATRPSFGGGRRKRGGGAGGGDSAAPGAAPAGQDAPAGGAPGAADPAPNGDSDQPRRRDRGAGGAAGPMSMGGATTRPDLTK